MWSKLRPIPIDDKKLRCSQIVERNHRIEKCTRVARLCNVHKIALAEIISQLPLCLAHRQHFFKMGFLVSLIDRRKRSAKGTV